jgi:hypothetical protein
MIGAIAWMIFPAWNFATNSGDTATASANVAFGCARENDDSLELLLLQAV